MKLEDLPPDAREAYEERAAIMEYDANMPRAEAERKALAATLEEFSTCATTGKTQVRITGTWDVERIA